MTTQLTPKVVLGSRSPQRLALLRLAVPEELVEVVPPRSADEASFAHLDDWPAVETRLRDVARRKLEDVLDQLRERPPANHGRNVAAVVTADTIIVAGDRHGKPVVLGQPPADVSWPEIVRYWFRDYYAGRTHVAATALCVGRPDEPVIERLVKSQVTFHADVERWLDWYISTGEPCGKAGGYAIQGAGDLFVSSVTGSISNVVGLPLRELIEAFEELGVALQ